MNCLPTGVPWSLASDFSYRDTLGTFESLLLSTSLPKCLELQTVTTENRTWLQEGWGEATEIAPFVSIVSYGMTDRVGPPFWKPSSHFPVMAAHKIVPSKGQLCLCEKRGL